MSDASLPPGVYATKGARLGKGTRGCFFYGFLRHGVIRLGDFCCGVLVVGLSRRCSVARRIFLCTMAYPRRHTSASLFMFKNVSFLRLFWVRVVIHQVVWC